jgi:nucleoid DNA-binding protein
MSLNRAQFVELLQKQIGKETSKAAADRALTSVLETLEIAIKKHKGVTFVGAFSVEVVARKARKGINPQTQKPITIKARKVVKFKAGSSLKAAAANA